MEDKLLEPAELDMDDVESIDISAATLLAIVEEAKELVRDELEAEIRAEYEAKYAVEYRGVLGFFARLAGLIPDSHGKGSGSWTVYILSHLPPLIVVTAWAIAFLAKISMKGVTMISPWIVLAPMFLSWVAWLAHHRKVTDSVVAILDSLGRAFAGFKGKASAPMVAAATAVVDKTLKAGEKVEVKQRPTDKKPKTDPSTLEVPPS